MKKMNARKNSQTQTTVDATDLAEALKIKSTIRAGIIGIGANTCRTCGLGGGGGSGGGGVVGKVG